MDIFESLENLNVSEECFNSIMNIIEKALESIDRPELVKQYGTTEVQKLPKEVRRMHYPKNKDDVTGGLREKWGTRRNARSHQEFLNYIPKSDKDKIEGAKARFEKKLKPISYYLNKLRSTLDNSNSTN